MTDMTAETVVLGDLADGRLSGATAELIALGRKLGAPVAAALAGVGLESAASEALAAGADKAYLLNSPVLAEPQTDALVAAFEQLCKHSSPAVVLVAKTPIGRDVGPRLATRLGVGLAQDCVDLRRDSSGTLIAIRPVYGGNALAALAFSDARPSIVVVRGKVYPPLAPDPARKGEIVRFEPKLDPSAVKARTVEFVRREAAGVRLEDAAVVVSGGRGLGGPEPFGMLKELAGLLDGAVGASRAACDAGWIDHSYQVGLTGKTITPNVYITVGISGASQHMAGCSGAKNIVAINKDANANIFKEARYGVVGDWKKVLPSFIEAVRELVKS